MKKDEVLKTVEDYSYDLDSVDWDVYHAIDGDKAGHGITEEEFDEAWRRGYNRAQAEEDARKHTYEEMLAKAQGLFGPKAEIYYADHQWIISTGCGEKFDVEKYKNHVAYDAFHEPEGSYGTQLQRWAYKNGHGSASMVEVFAEYEASQLRNWKSAWELVVKAVREEKPFDWEGGNEYRDRVLEVGKEQGWDEESV